VFRPAATPLKVKRADLKTVIRETISNDQGSEIAEAALVLPLVFMILMGIYWFGLAFNTYATINHAAREGARLAVASTCATCGNFAANDTTIATAVTAAMQASSVDPNPIIIYQPTYNYCNGLQQNQNCNTSSKITICKSVQLQNPPVNTAGLGQPACGVAVSFQYPYQFWLPFTSLNNQKIILTADVQMTREF
jgi:Flp pilus assembly protein TadG